MGRRVAGPPTAVFAANNSGPPTPLKQHRCPLDEVRRLLEGRLIFYAGPRTRLLAGSLEERPGRSGKNLAGKSDYQFPGVAAVGRTSLDIFTSPP